MKERRKSIYQKLPPVKLYLDDIRRIYSIIKSSYTTVRIETDEHELDSTDDLKKIESDSLSELTIIGTNSSYESVSANFERDGAFLFASEDSIPNRGILSKIDEALVDSKRKVARLLVSWAFYPVLLLTPAILVFLIEYFTRGWLKVALCICLAVVTIGIYANAFMIGDSRYSTISLIERHKDKSFLARNKDLILVGVITAIITAALTLAATKLAE
jgi:hypothetical protein